MKSWLRNLLILVVIIISLGFPLVMTVVNWSSVESCFYNYNFIDIYGIFITVLIGTGITIFFTSKFSNSSTRLNIIGVNIDSLQEVHSSIIEKVKESSNKELTKSDKQILLRLFRISSIEITNIHNYLIECSQINKGITETINLLKTEALILKSIITDEPFQGSNILSSEASDSAINKYYDIKFNLQKLKLLLYK